MHKIPLYSPFPLKPIYLTNLQPPNNKPHLLSLIPHPPPPTIIPPLRPILHQLSIHPPIPLRRTLPQQPHRLPTMPKNIPTKRLHAKRPTPLRPQIPPKHNRPRPSPQQLHQPRHHKRLLLDIKQMQKRPDVDDIDLTMPLREKFLVEHASRVEPRLKRVFIPEELVAQVHEPAFCIRADDVLGWYAVVHEFADVLSEAAA